MLFQLDDLKLPPHSFRTLYSIIRIAYKSKLFNGSLEYLVDKTGQSLYHIRKSLKDLIGRGFIQVKHTAMGLEICLLPVIIKIIDKDWNRRGAAETITAPKPATKKNRPPTTKPTGKKPCTQIEQPVPTTAVIGKEAMGSGSTDATSPIASSHSTRPIKRDTTNKAGLSRPEKKPSGENFIVPGPWLGSRGDLRHWFVTFLLESEKLTSTQMNEALSSGIQLSKFWDYYKEHCYNILRSKKTFGTEVFVPLGKLRECWFIYNNFVKEQQEG